MFASIFNLFILKPFEFISRVTEIWRICSVFRLADYLALVDDVNKSKQVLRFVDTSDRISDWIGFGVFPLLGFYTFFRDMK